MSRTKKFKMTDLGPIPEDWEVERIAENALPLRNNTLAREAMCETSSGVGNVHYGDVLIKYDSVLDCTESCVPDLIDGELYCKDCLQDGDVVFADTAEDETVGKAVEITNILDRKIVAGLHTIAFRPREKFERGWLGYFVNSKTYHDQLLPLIVGTKVCSVSRSGVGQTFWARPTASEQRRIAAALSDADELIAALTELLEKKRNLKQGAMQQLLTGKRRLPGFKGKWVEKTLEDVAVFETKTVPVKSFNAQDYVSTENMLQNKAGILPNCEEIPYANVREYRTGDILVSNIRPYLQKIWFATHNGGCSTDVHVVRVRSEADCLPRYLNLILSQDSFFDFAMETATGTKMPRGDKRRIVTYSFLLPLLEDEQRAIAEVLSDMDEEIAGIEVELEKAKNVKTGMMQQLLTGKVRLEVA